MGERFQAYVAFTAGTEKKTVVVGAHHQWLYGNTAAEQTLRAMALFTHETQTREHAFTPFNPRYNNATGDDVFRVLESIYSSIPEWGYISEDRVIRLTGSEILDPRLADNNCGIAIFGLRDYQKPAYCFMRITVGDTLTDAGLQFGGVPYCKPLSGATYLNIFYPMRGTRLKHPGWQKIISGSRKRVELATKQVARFQKYPVMTFRQCQEIFPALYAKKSELVPATAA